MISLSSSSLVRSGGLFVFLLSLDPTGGSFCIRSLEFGRRGVQVIADPSRPDPRPCHHRRFTCYRRRQPLQDAKDGKLEDGRSRVMQATMGVAVSRALALFVEWNVADVLATAKTAQSVEAISTAIFANRNRSVDADLIRRCLRLLATQGFVQEQDPSGHFMLTQMGVQLFGNTHNNDDNGENAFGTALVQYALDDALWDAWRFVSDYQSTSGMDSNSDDDTSLLPPPQTPFQVSRGGQSTVEYYGQNPLPLSAANRFVRDMSTWELEAVRDALDWHEFITRHSTHTSCPTTVKTLVDLGGHYGELLQSIQSKFPHISGICVDLPDVIAGAKTRDIEFVAANLMEEASLMSALSAATQTPVPVVLLKHILLCEFDEADSRRILENCHALIADEGCVMVAEAMLDTHSRTTSPLSSSSSALVATVDFFLVLDGRPRVRSISEWRAFASTAGFVVDSYVTTPCPTCSVLLILKRDKTRSS